MWLAVLAGAAGCYLCKLVGLAVPQRVLADPRTQRVAALLPLTLLAALAVAALAVLLRAPFLLVVALAAATAALVRLYV